MEPIIDNKSIIDVNINHIGKLVYIMLPMLVICDTSANLPSHICDVTKDNELLNNS